MRLVEREEHRQLRVPITSSTLPCQDQNFRRAFTPEKRWMADPACTGRAVFTLVESAAETAPEDFVWSLTVDPAYPRSVVLFFGAVTASSDDDMSQESQEVRVSERDYETIAAALRKPPAPSPALQRAVEIYRAR